MRPLVRRSISCVELQQLNTSDLSVYKGQLVLIKSSFQEGRPSHSVSRRHLSLISNWCWRDYTKTTAYKRYITLAAIHNFWSFVFEEWPWLPSELKRLRLKLKEKKSLFSVTPKHLNHSEIVREGFFCCCCFFSLICQKLWKRPLHAKGQTYIDIQPFWLY